ncbi:hypothetical protein [Oscillatoria sp. FACHB-1406]|uniref:hypothetical protein n=1 Tax=Oscillatoria sp. FACHB-1406 TaxID=2692846 RepID=UPI0016859297|nr:hypothetical protein [Oscillatoria sp. FACHB-1406]MBD2576109.1 hypothetical protein [Oscillatoria sp. FACHB-1406]
MEPISMIIAALGAGAIAATKDTAETAVKDAYQALKTLIKKKFEGEPKAEMVLEEHETDPETYNAPLKKKLAEAGVDKDAAILQAAQELLNQVKEQPGGQQIITQNISNVKYAATSGSGSESISGITEQSLSKDE